MEFGRGELPVPASRIVSASPPFTDTVPSCLRPASRSARNQAIAVDCHTASAEPTGDHSTTTTPRPHQVHACSTTDVDVSMACSIIVLDGNLLEFLERRDDAGCWRFHAVVGRDRVPPPSPAGMKLRCRQPRFSSLRSGDTLPHRFAGRCRRYGFSGCHLDTSAGPFDWRFVARPARHRQPHCRLEPGFTGAGARPTTRPPRFPATTTSPLPPHPRAGWRTSTTPDALRG